FKDILSLHEQHRKHLMLSLEERNDSWQNLLSGLGTARDKTAYTHVSPNHALSTEYLEQLYFSDDIAARICEIIPYEMLRQGISIKVNGENFIYDGLNDLLREVLLRSRIFGAAFLYMGVDDGQEQYQPLAIQRVRDIRFLNPLTT